MDEDPVDLEAHYQASIVAWHREQRDPAATKGEVA